MLRLRLYSKCGNSRLSHGICAVTDRASCSIKRLPGDGGTSLALISTLMGSSNVTDSPAPIELGIRAWLSVGSSHREGRTVMGIRQDGDGIPPKIRKLMIGSEHYQWSITDHCFAL